MVHDPECLFIILSHLVQRGCGCVECFSKLEAVKNSSPSFRFYYMPGAYYVHDLI